MFDETSPILLNVAEARQLGMIGNYDDSLKLYSQAKELIEFELKNCRNHSELTKWNALMKHLVQEESSVRRIRSTIDDIVKELNIQDAQKDMAVKNKLDDALKPDFDTSPQVRRPKVQDQKSLRNNQPKGKKPAGNYKQPKVMKPLPPQKACPPTKIDEKNENNQHASPPPELPVADNPLKQQIIDMGILIREPNVEWESIAGLAGVKRMLRQHLVILPMRPDIAQGLLSPWRSVLFYGPPGTGKTFLAKAIATECHRTFFNITSATITSRFHGESEKLVTFLFDIAYEMKPSTLFFDEIDSLASQRGTQGENEASRKMKAQLLTRMEGIDATEDSSVFVLAATNFPWDLDEAILRRFQKRVYIPLPDYEARRSLLQMSIESIMDDDFDVDDWAQRLEGYSCADISNVCKDAAQMVLDRETEMLDTQAWINLPTQEARIRVGNDDFAQALAHRKSSVNASSIKKYEEWRDSRGAE